MGILNHLLPKSTIRYGFRNAFMRTFIFGLVGSLSMYISSWEKADRIKDQYFHKGRSHRKNFDFIVIGGGTAGSLVAHRLAEAQYRVLLLEAGGEPHPFQSIPLISSVLMSHYKELDWMHKSTSQQYAFLGSMNEQAQISQGKGLGGSSNLNYMMHLRGNPKDYDNWALWLNDESWKYENLLVYFKKLEAYSGPWNASRFHGRNGNLPVRPPMYNSILGKRFVKACKQSGYPNVDLNGDYYKGCDIIPNSIHLGHRRTTYTTFIKSLTTRWNLVVSKYSHVNKILVTTETNSAYGVEYEKHGERTFAFAKKEVILSAGTINSPKLLMLSGIGPENHLRQLGIPVRKHAPLVGTNFQDQASIFLGPFFTQKWKSLLIDRDLSTSVPQLWGYAAHGGPLTSTGYQAAAMLHSLRNPPQAPPNIQLTMFGLGHHKSAGEDFSHAYGVKKQLVSSYFDSSLQKDSFSILISATRPKSRGYVWLQNANPHSAPLVDPNYLQNPFDVHTLMDGIQKSLLLVEESPTFRHIGAKLTTRKFPGCESYPHRSNAYWECYIRMFTVSTGGIAGTVPMGQTYEFGVVDTELKVFGVERLRVMDSSVMPNIVSSGPEVATMVIAEKGADMILDLWGRTAPREEFYKEAQSVAVTLRQIAKEMRNTNVSYSNIPYFNKEEEDISKEEEVISLRPQQQPVVYGSSVPISNIEYGGIIDSDSYGKVLPLKSVFEGHDNYVSLESKITVENKTHIVEELPSGQKIKPDYELLNAVQSSELLDQFFSQKVPSSETKANESQKTSTELPITPTISSAPQSEKQSENENADLLQEWTKPKTSYKNTVNSILSLSLPLISKKRVVRAATDNSQLRTTTFVPKSGEITTTTMSPLTSFRQAFSPLVKLLRGVPMVDRIARPFQNMTSPFEQLVDNFKKFRKITSTLWPKPIFSNLTDKPNSKPESYNYQLAASKIITTIKSKEKKMNVSVNVKGDSGAIVNAVNHTAHVQPTNISSFAQQSIINVPFPYTFVLKPAASNSSDPQYLYFPQTGALKSYQNLERVPPDYELISDNNNTEFERDEEKVNTVQNGIKIEKFKLPEFPDLGNNVNSLLEDESKNSYMIVVPVKKGNEKLPFHKMLIKKSGSIETLSEVKNRIDSMVSTDNMKGDEVIKIGSANNNKEIANETDNNGIVSGKKLFVKFANSSWDVTPKYEDDTISFNLKIY